VNWKGFGRKRSRFNLSQAYYPEICQEELRKVMKILELLKLPCPNLKAYKGNRGIDLLIPKLGT
jgi:hypothetical protein